jgi:Flp pilus assembly protein TadD
MSRKENNFSIGTSVNLQLLFGAIILIVILLTTYQKALDNEFVDWDDFTYVVNNDLVRNPGEPYMKELFTTPVSSNYHPITILSLRLNNNKCTTCPEGISPAPFILWNIIIHILNTLLVLILVFMLSGRNITVAFLTAAMFGVHPMHVESIAWIAERKDVLYSFFFLAGLIIWLKFKSAKKAGYLWYLICFLLFVLSCLSKAMAVVFPVVLILLNIWNGNKLNEKTPVQSLKESISIKSLVPLLPFFIVSVFFGLLAYQIQNGENLFGILNMSNNSHDVVNMVGPFSLFQRFQISAYGFVVYIIKFLLPVNLLALHPYPGDEEFTSGFFAASLILSLIVCIVLILLIIRSFKRSKLYFFGIGFYLITIALVLQFISVGTAIVAERYSYLPYIGLAFIPATLIANTSKSNRKFWLFIAGCFIVLMIFISRKQTEVWSNTETLWSGVLEKHPQLEMPRRSRGKYYSKLALKEKNEMKRKELEDKALTDFNIAIESESKNADVFQGAGIIYGSRGELLKGIGLLNTANTLEPENGGIYYNRALILSQLNRNEEAISDYTLALRYQPEKAYQIINNRSNLLLTTGRFNEAVRDFDYLISANRNYFIYFYNRAFAKEQLEDISGALKDYFEALKLSPDDQMTRERIKELLYSGK